MGSKEYFNKIKQWDSFVSSMKCLKQGEELMFTLGRTQYVVRVAEVHDIARHERDGESLE